MKKDFEPYLLKQRVRVKVEEWAGAISLPTDSYGDGGSLLFEKTTVKCLDIGGIIM